ncbi:MAG: purine-binding chemotaxis protein CheW [Blastocatellia bacterium]|nr:purine-binding chemotaxis protein CheW [Blastocatellia bacterium]
MALDLHLVTFRVGAELIGVPIAKVQEIMRLPTITQIPRAPGFVEGVINLRGRVIPVIDMRKRLGQIPCDESAPHDEQSRILVVEAEHRLVGVIVDEVSEMIKLAEERVEAAPPMVSGLSNHYIKGVGKLDDVLLILMDIEKVLTADELTRIDSMLSTETRAA